jgi:type I restriction enzyme S subunit
MIEDKNTPRLRFQFSGDWEEKKVEKIAPLQRGFDLPVSQIKDGEYPVVFSNGILKHHFQAKVKGPGIITGRSGTIGKVTFVEMDFWPHNTSLWVTDFAGNDPKFVFYFYINLKLKRFESGSGVPTLNRNDVHLIKKRIPSLPEQQKIASFLSSVDERIELLEQKKEKLEVYKKGVMQQIFSQQIRFRRDDGAEFPDWEERKLGEVLKETKLKNSGNKLSEVFSVSKHKGVINQIDHLGRSYAADSIEHYKVANPFDIIYTKSPTSEFPFGIIKQNLTNRSGVLSPLYGVFRPKTPELGTILHNYFSSWVNTYNYLVPLVQKGAKNTMNINNDDFLNGAKISLPVSHQEQKKITSMISSFDSTLSDLSEELEKLKNWKKGLLQQMFV